jgi:hypothetical protein
VTVQGNISDLKKSLAYAFERTDFELRNLDKIIEEINSEFKNLPEKEIIKAIRNGAFGKYGRTYKLSTQEVCFWIYSYLKEKESKRLKL